jgi:RecA/RadA recombinase
VKSKPKKPDPKPAQPDTSAVISALPAPPSAKATPKAAKPKAAKATATAEKKTAKKKGKKSKRFAELKTVDKASMSAVLDALEQEEHTEAIELRVKQPDHFLSTRSLVLDLLLGGGFYGGQVFQIYGVEHAGKSTLLYSCAASVRQLGIPLLFFDHEGTTDKAYVNNLGLNIEEQGGIFRYYRPEHGDATYRMVMRMLDALPVRSTGLPAMAIFIDTVATMPTEGEMELEESKRPALRATMHSKWWGMLKTMVARKHVAIIAANQVRSNAGALYTSPEVIPGGNAWKFATDSLLRVGRGKVIELPNGSHFQEMRLKTYKNKNAVALQEATIHLHLGQGVDPASDVLTFCKKLGLLVTEKNRPPAIRGLGAGLDKTYPSLEALEALIRDPVEGASFYAPCRQLLTSGEAAARYRALREPERAAS